MEIDQMHFVFVKKMFSTGFLDYSIQFFMKMIKKSFSEYFVSL